MSFNPLTPNRRWRTLAFLPLLTSSLLTKIGIIYTQLLQEEKIFPMMPRSEWSAEWSLRYAQKCSKSWVKIPATTPGCSMLKFASLDDASLEVFLTASKPSGRSVTAAKRKENEKKGRGKKIPKIEKPKDVGHFLVSKFWFLRMPESQWDKTRCWWQERQAVVLQTHFRPD